MPRSDRHRPGPQLRDLVQVSAGFDASRSPQPCYVLGCVDTAGTRTRTEVGGDLEAALRLLLQLGCPLRHAAWVRRGATLRLDRARDGGWQVTRYRPGPVPGAAGLTRQVRPGRRAEGDGAGTRRLAVPAPTRAVPVATPGRRR